MASQWHSLISQKIYLARTLLAQRDSADSLQVQEGLWQGSAELALRSRKLVLVMIARFYQEKQAEPSGLDALQGLLGSDIPEVAELERMGGDNSSWWSYLGQVEHFLTRPRTTRKTVSDDNIIAVAADNGPDRSSKALGQALTDLKHFIDDLEERHSEW